jgi:heme-degrading monooxygenase HmoA
MAIMEIARLRVAEEKAAGLVAARPRMLKAFADRRGFLRADLVRVSDTEWLDLIVWATSADFAESRRRGGDSDAVLAYFAQIDEVLSSQEGQLWEP